MTDYFKRLTDRLFKTDESGRILFYPWGWGKGYIVNNKKAEARIRQFVAYYYACSFGLIAAFLFTGYTAYSSILLVPIFVVWQIGTKALTKPLETTEIRFTFSERMKKIARGRSRALLLMAAIISIVFLALSIRDFIAHKSLYAGFFVVFFGVLAIGNWYILILKDN